MTTMIKRNVQFFTAVFSGSLIMLGLSAQAPAQTDPPQKQIWKDITTGGWPKSLAPFQKRFRTGRSYLALYEKLPIWPIDMRSPDRFKRSMGSREIFGHHSIGHMAIGWSCATGTPSSTPDSVGFTAQTGEDSSQQKKMLEEDDWGVTALISTFTDGHMQTGPQIDEYFEEVYSNAMAENRNAEPFFALVIEVDSSDCEKVRDFTKTYVFHPSNPYKNFGMVPDPAKFEGAGCGSFAITALAQAPTLQPIMTTFWRTMPIPEKTLGRRTGVYKPNNVDLYVRAKTQADEYRVGMKRLLLMNWDIGKTALNLRFVDPELSIFALKKFATLGDLSAPRSLNRFFNFPSRSGEASTGGPEDSDFGFQDISAQFDVSFGRVAAAVEAWWSARSPQMRVTPIEITNGQGVMIESR